DWKYDQCLWRCGTTCCLWGGAHVAAGLKPPAEGPSLQWSRQSPVHTGLRSALSCRHEDTALRLARQVLAGEITIGEDAVIRDRAEIGYHAEIGPGAEIGDDVRIGYRAEIGEGAVIGYGA